MATNTMVNRIRDPEEKVEQLRNEAYHLENEGYVRGAKRLQFKADHLEQMVDRRGDDLLSEDYKAMLLLCDALLDVRDDSITLRAMEAVDDAYDLMNTAGAEYERAMQAERGKL